MLKLLHNIAGCCFLSEADVESEFLQQGYIERFRLKQGQAQITQILKEIPDELLVLPPLASKAFNEICQGNANEIIRGDTLTISPTLSTSTIKKLAVSFNFKDSYYPLLDAEIVRTAINKKMARPETCRLQLHKLVVEVFDYDQMIFQVFFHSSLSYMLKYDLSFNGMKRLFAAAFPSYDSMLVHSSAIIVDDRVAIFMAQDEGGKSTAVSLGNKQKILCDDFNVLSKRNGICEVHSTPWGNLCNGPVSAPLGGLFFLEKASAFALRSISAQEALTLIWKENSRFFDNILTNTKIRIFNILYDICRETPAYIMRFPKNYIDWQAIQNSIKP